MARTTDHQGESLRTGSSGQGRPTKEQPAPEPERPVVLTPEGHRWLVARAAWLATEPDQAGWTDGGYGRALTELARLNSALAQAITTDELPPENPDVVELGDEVVVEFAPGETERFLVVNPVEAPLDQLRISVESPLAQALVGRRVGEQVDVMAPSGLYRCRIVATRRHPMAAGS
jgi:hypothetical protein